MLPTLAESATAPLILVVDADPALQQILSSGLTARAFRVRIAANLREALAAIDREPPSLVLLDLDLLSLDDSTLAHGLEPEAWRVPVVLMGSDEYRLATCAGGLGAVAYLVKPVALAAL